MIGMVAPPTWVRELKRHNSTLLVENRRRTPTWVRELKHGYHITLHLTCVSRTPTWVRELKLQFNSVK